MDKVDFFLLILRIINIILVTITTSGWIIFYKYSKNVAAFAPISWLIHVLIFGIYRLVNPHVLHNPELMNLWLALLIMHNSILLLVASILSIPGYRKKGQNNEPTNI